jgi:hypothetical protein
MQSLPHELVTIIGAKLHPVYALRLYTCCKLFREKCYKPHIEEFVKFRKYLLLQQIKNIKHETCEEYTVCFGGANYESYSRLRLPRKETIYYAYSLIYRCIDKRRVALISTFHNCRGEDKRKYDENGKFIGWNHCGNYCDGKFWKASQFESDYSLQWYVRRCRSGEYIIQHGNKGPIEYYQEIQQSILNNTRA